MNAVRAAFASLTAGQRWTAALAVTLGVVVLVFGLPEQPRRLAPVPVTAATAARPPAPSVPAPTASSVPPLQLAVLPALTDLGFGAAADEPTSTTTTTASPPAGPPPPPTTVCTPPLGVTLTGIPQLDALICTVIASLPVV